MKNDTILIQGGNNFDKNKNLKSKHRLKKEDVVEKPVRSFMIIKINGKDSFFDFV